MQNFHSTKPPHTKGAKRGPKPKPFSFVPKSPQRINLTAATDSIINNDDIGIIDPRQKEKISTTRKILN